jgi:cytochrome bd-type quinol oxidase subunit 2
MLKKILIILILLSIFSLALPVAAQGSMGEALNKTAEQADYSGNRDLFLFTAQIVQALLGILGLLFVILLVYGGATWMTSMADPKKIEKAKNIIKASIIGLIIIVCSYSIAYFVTTGLESAADSSGAGGVAAPPAA